MTQVPSSTDTPLEQAPLGVLLMAYGTPRQVDEVEAYYTHIRHGHPPTKELLDDLLRRYQAIGGLSPLNAITEAEAHGLETALNADGGRPVRVYLGMKHTHPFIGDTVRQMSADGITEAVTLVLAPHYSTRSVAEYQRAASDAAQATGKPTLYHVDFWYDNEKFLQLIANRVRSRLTEFSNSDDVMVVFSAHSLPEKILAAGDPYQDQLHATGNAVAEALNLKHYMFACLCGCCVVFAVRPSTQGCSFVRRNPSGSLRRIQMRAVRSVRKHLRDGLFFFSNPD